MNTIQLSTQERTVFGRRVQALREQGIVPAVVYGHGFDAISIQVSAKDFENVYKQSGETTVVQLMVGDQKLPVLIKDVARDAVQDNVIHVDFYKVRLDQKIKASIPLNFINEAPAVKDLSAILVKNMTELEVEGFPQDLPHAIDVDLASLTTMTSQILVSDIKVAGTLEVQAEADAVIALVQEPAKEEEVVAAPSIEDVEIGEKKPADEDAEAEATTEETKE